MQIFFGFGARASISLTSERLAAFTLGPEKTPKLPIRTSKGTIFRGITMALSDLFMVGIPAVTTRKVNFNYSILTLYDFQTYSNVQCWCFFSKEYIKKF